MASKLLLRILTAARPGIQTGKLKMQDIVSEYFKQTGGKTIDPGERAIIENEFIKKVFCRNANGHSYLDRYIM